MAKKPAKTKANKHSSVKSARNPYLLVFILIFALVGGYTILHSNADTGLPTYSDDIVVGYINMTPTAITQDEIGNISYQMYPATTYVMRDGTLVCDPGSSSNNTVATGQLSNKEIGRLHQDVVGTGVQSLPDTILGDGNQTMVNFEGILVGGANAAKGTAVNEGGTKPNQFVQAQNRLQKMCAKANRTEERSSLKAARQPNLKKTDQTSFISHLATVVTPKVSACCSVGTHEANSELLQLQGVNYERSKRGIAKVTRNSCMDNVALGWTQVIAKQGYLSHNPNWDTQIAKCGRWTSLGENVGYGPDSSALMTAFMNSAGHKANILNSNFTNIGIGAIRVSGRLYVTQDYAKF